tara:strand:+ start:131 stop:394 length:264 start_codon:yes stop_codon:yes gene_type:complete
MSKEKKQQEGISIWEVIEGKIEFWACSCTSTGSVRRLGTIIMVLEETYIPRKELNSLLELIKRIRPRMKENKIFLIDQLLRILRRNL